MATLAVADSVADAVTVKGPSGPLAINTLRKKGWDAVTIFDRAGYEPNVPSVEAERWFDEQEQAGADRLLTPGSWIGWDATGDAAKIAVEAEASKCDRRPGSTAVFAIDHRWLTRSPIVLANALNEMRHPAALVLAHASDPLSPKGAVQGLVALTRNVDNLSILRTDHGGLGAIVYGAKHAAIGLRGAHRHLVPPGATGGAKIGDRSPRLFVRDLMDWFTGITIAGWTTSRVNLRCPLACCGGKGLDRFFDPSNHAEAATHNRMTLSHLADEILDAPTDERRRRFGQMCLDALDLYGPMGKLSMVTRPKRQLDQWTVV